MWSANSDNTKEGNVSSSERSKKNLVDNSLEQSRGSNHKGEISAGCAVDSGFLSGTQLLDEDESSEVFEHKQPEEKLQNIPALSGPVHPNPRSKQLAAQENSYFDSGCIDVEEVDEEQKSTEDLPKKQMILENNVESGLNEWFCNLSLKNTEAPLNDLGAAKKSTVLTKPQAQPQPRQQQQQPKSQKHNWDSFYEQNEEGDTQVHLACIAGAVDVLAALIRMNPKDSNLDIRNDDMQTALHLAVLTGQPRMVRMLLLGGAKPDIIDRYGNTPLHLACAAGDLQCVKALTIPVSHSETQEAYRLYGYWGVDKTTSVVRYAQVETNFEHRNYEGERCIHLATMGGHIEILKHLIWFGADINAREGKSGRTPLIMAIESRNEVIANFLLEECSKINLETSTYGGLTAYQVASILKNSQMQSCLEKRGAETLSPPESDFDSDSDFDDDMQIYNRFGEPNYFCNYEGNIINVA